MFCIKIAGLTVGIDNRYRHVENLCRDYICHGEPSFCVRVTDDEIKTEMATANSEVTPDYAESICIYRAICQTLPEYGAFLLHASVVECDGVSYAFAAASGTGKSTHTALWMRHFGERARIINGDKPILRFDGDRVLVCGTPWCGKEGHNVNAESPLRALCFLERGEKNEITSIDSGEAVMRIFSQILLPTDVAAVDRLFALLDRMLRQIPCYLLRCTVSDEAVRVAYNGMRGF